MFGFAHAWELILLLVIALVIFGPKRLPEIGGALGKGIKEFKKSTTEEVEPASVSSTPVQLPPAQSGDVHITEKPVGTATPASTESKPQ